MRVAFASSDGQNVDRHFGEADAFHLWDVSPGSSTYLGQVAGSGATYADGAESEDRIVAKAQALQGCAIAYSLQIGGPAAAKLVARHIHPLKTTAVVPICELLAKLQAALSDRVPPWLARCSGLPVRRELSPGDEDP